jgi:hypothetical protein
MCAKLTHTRILQYATTDWPDLVSSLVRSGVDRALRLGALYGEPQSIRLSVKVLLGPIRDPLKTNQRRTHREGP